MAGVVGCGNDHTCLSIYSLGSQKIERLASCDRAGSMKVLNCERI